MTDEFTRIKTFIKVVGAGSFSAAARDVSSISSVARQVKSLEDDLGVRLLNRSTRSLSLTDVGRCFYERAKAITNDLSIAEAEVRSLHDGVRGHLSVSLRVAAGTTVIMPALPQLLAQYPDLSLDITLSDERRDLIANEIDVAVWLGEPPNADIVARRLSPSCRIVCASQGYLERRGIPRAPQDLRRHECLVHSTLPYCDRWSFTREGQHKEVEVRGGVRSDNSMVLLSSAVAGLGLVIVQQWMVGPLIAAGRIQRVLGEWTVSPRQGDAALYAVYPTSRGLSRKVRVFVDFLLETFGAPGGRGLNVASPRH
ncbi:LysR family transcriptional regulator [Variovorax sp. WS11]|uniref:LysR family transcriptional regulator n=1 Tax=Variovorax sp. WS11 TaxID=1105204 RepID=UPI001EF19624|nr:LysR family transcriptional regulator [Variovorax sp. WS11]